MEFINQCYDLFVNYQIERIRKKYTISEQRLKKESEYYEELLKNLKQENSKDSRDKLADILTLKAHNSLFARLRDLILYVTQRVKEEKLKEDIQQFQPNSHKQKYCTYIVPGKGRTRDEIEADLQEISQKSAQRFARLLLNLEKQGFLDFRGDSSSEVFEYLSGRYGLKYSLGNFTRYFNK